MDKLIKLPKEYYETKTVMSNIDHSIDKKVEKEIVDGKYYGQYASWNFCGYVWHQEEKFYCEIWVYGSHVETIQADTLEEIMSEACSKYGSE